MIAANRRVEENAMWAKRRAELGQDDTRDKEDSIEAGKSKGDLRRDNTSRESDGTGKEMGESAFRAWIKSAPKKGRGSVGALADEEEECRAEQRRKDCVSSSVESFSSLESSDSIQRKHKRKKRRHKEREEGSRKIRKRHNRHRREHKEKRRRRKHERASK